MDIVSIDTRTAALCTGHKRRTGERCRAIAVKGTTKCKFHGGRSLRGVGHPSFQHGRYSKDLSTQLAARADRALHDPQLLSLAEDIAVNQALLGEALQRLGTGESGATWRAVRETYEAMRLAIARGDTDAMQREFDALGTLMRQGVGEAATRRELRELEETHAKLIQTQVKTLQTMQQMITVQQNQLMLGALYKALAAAVQAHTDVASGRKILMAVGAEMTRLSTQEAR
jgi:hypothetical protein